MCPDPHPYQMSPGERAAWANGYDEAERSYKADNARLQVDFDAAIKDRDEWRLAARFEASLRREYAEKLEESLKASCEMVCHWRRPKIT